MCSSVVGISALLYGHLHCPISEQSHHLAEESHPHELPSSPASGTHSSTFCLYGLTLLNVSHKSSHIISGLWWLAFAPGSSGVTCVLVHCMAVPDVLSDPFVNQLMDIWVAPTWGLSWIMPLWTFMFNSVRPWVFLSLTCKARTGTARSCDNSVSNMSRTCQTLPHSVYTTLLSHPWSGGFLLAHSLTSTSLSCNFF